MCVDITSLVVVTKLGDMLSKHWIVLPAVGE
jgi:hypothetical protein